MYIEKCVVCQKYLPDIGEQERGMCNPCDNKTQAIAKEFNNLLSKEIIMTTATEAHLTEITKENFTSWLNDTFISYASSMGKNGLVELGVDGRGNPVIRTNHKTGKETYYYSNVNKAIEAYGDFLTGDNVPVPAVRVRFYPKDSDETFVGTVIEETQYSYLVIPDDNVVGTARWNKKYCDVLR
jgi:hypothetical protein